MGEYLEVDSPRLLVYSWVASWTGDVKTTVRWELEPTGKGTLVKIRHSGLAAHPELAKSYRGWPRMLRGGSRSSSKKGRQSRCVRHCRPNPSSRRNQHRTEP